jgi:hypothetical protein
MDLTRHLNAIHHPQRIIDDRDIRLGFDRLMTAAT